MKTTEASKFRRIILVNWLDLPYGQIDLDGDVTIFEGGNGSGKSSVLLAALLTLMPDRKQLRSRKVTIEKNIEEAVFHRLQPEEPIAYACMEIQLANELVLAGVHITKQRESNNIELEVFTIRKWPEHESVQDFFRFVDDEREWTCDLNDLKQRAGEWGVDFHAHAKLSSYFKELYDLGILPLAMATDSERSQYAHLLETSMAGGLSSGLADRLKNYLLPEYEKLPEATKFMYDNLLACISTQHELKASGEQYERIGGLFKSLANYITAVGGRIKRGKDAANEQLKLTESNLETTETQLKQLEKEKADLQVKKGNHDAAKTSAISDLQTLIESQRQEQRRLEGEIKGLTGQQEEFKKRLGPIKTAEDELQKAIEGLKKLLPDVAKDLTGEQVDEILRGNIGRAQEELRQLNELIRVYAAEITALKSHHGVDSELMAVAEAIGGTPVLKQYANIKDLKEASVIEATLGPLVRGLIVKNTEEAAKKIIKLEANLTEIWLTDSKDPASNTQSQSQGNFQKVNYEGACRMTRIPATPVLGDTARKNRLQDLDAQIRARRLESADLQKVERQFDSLRRHTLRIPDGYGTRALSWIKSEAASLQKQNSELETRIEKLTGEFQKAGEAMGKAAGRIQEVVKSFELPEQEINSAIRQNDTALALKGPLKERLETERTEGIAKFTLYQGAWQTVSELPELSAEIRGDLPDLGGALERLKTSLQQVDGPAATALPEVTSEDIAQLASDLVRVRRIVRSLIQTIQPHNLTESSEPEAVIQALTQKISTLTTRLDDQQNAFRNNIDTIADAIHSEINKRTQRILRWSNDLREVQFGTVKGIRLRLDRIPEQLEILDGLRQQKELFSKSDKDPKAALQEFWKQRTGQELTTENALDYRRFVTLVIEVGDGQGKWRPVGGSTGEMTGAALSVLIVLLRAWEEEATLRERVHPLRLLFLDEAARLDPSSHATLEALSAGLATQLVVAAPVVATSGKFTHYVLTRKQVGNRRQVFIRGRRRFCDSEQANSQT